MIRNEVKQLDAALPVYAMKTVEGQLDETLLTDRLIALLSGGFGLLATLLASIGLYGVWHSSSPVAARNSASASRWARSRGSLSGW